MLHFLHLCPTGPILKEIETFRHHSRDITDRNSALRYPVHCTLVRGFRAKRRRQQVVENLLDSEFGALESPLTIQSHCIYRGNRRPCIGISLRARGVVTRIGRIAEVLKQHDFALVQVLHITLAVGFRSNEESRLLQLAREIDLKAVGYWAVKLFAQEPCATCAPVKEWQVKW